MVLFGKKTTRFIPQSKIRLTVYPSKKTGDTFIEDKIFENNMFLNIQEIFQYLDVIYGKTISVDGMLRTEKINYPILAMREGILNAIIHRDYNATNGFLQISIFPNRTEINNYGGLPNGVTLKDLKIEHHSILRNPDIAQIAFVRKYVELLGSGTLRMMRDCKQNKFPPPVWKEKDNIFTVTFPSVAHGMSTFEGVTEGVTEGIIEGITDDVKDKIKKIVLLIRNTEGIRTTDIERKTDIPIKSIERYLKILKDNDIIEFRGANRTGGYYLKQK